MSDISSTANSICTNTWMQNLHQVANREYTPTQYTDYQLLARVFPDNHATVVFDNLGHPLAYFSWQSRVGVSPVYGFDGTLPEILDYTDYLDEVLSVVAKQIDLLRNWPGWDAWSFVDLFTNKMALLAHAETIHRLFTTNETHRNLEILKLRINPAFDSHFALNLPQQRTALNEFITYVSKDSLFYLGE